MVRIATESSYDEVPYESGLIPGSHPDRLATIARIFGVPAADPEACSVLEIGCAAATNLLPMAYSLPNSTFVGIDASQRQIEMGKAFVADYGATNVELLALDVREILEWDRKFDYIICHGVFSWVEEDVQEAILEACRRLLNPAGVAYVSYNTLPGFHTRAPIREMLRFHANHFKTPKERAEQSRSLLVFLAEATGQLRGPTFTPYHLLIEAERSMLANMDDSYVIHEHLEDTNEAFYFHEFIDLATAHDLQYLGDVAFHTMMLSDLPGEIGEKIGAIASTQMALEQYRDFVVNRMFRKTLLCQKEAKIDRKISIESLQGLQFRKRLAQREDGTWQIEKTGESVVQVSDASVQSVLQAVSEASPRSLSFDELSSAASGIVGAVMEEEKLAGIILSLFALDALDVRSWTPIVATEVPERPEVFPPARRLPAGKRYWAPLPQHGFARMEPVIAAMLHLIDGTRTQDEIIDAVDDEVQRGVFVVEGMTPEEMPGRDATAELVPQVLRQLVDVGMLVAP